MDPTGKKRFGMVWDWFEDAVDSPRLVIHKPLHTFEKCANPYRLTGQVTTSSFASFGEPSAKHGEKSKQNPLRKMGKLNRQTSYEDFFGWIGNFKVSTTRFVYFLPIR